MTTFVLVHGAWHRGDCWDEVAAELERAGHEVHAPTIRGNGATDSKDIGLDDAVSSLVSFISEKALTDAVLVAHSWGGIVISAAADRLPAGTVGRLVYWSAYVPLDGESLVDITPPAFGEMFKQTVDAEGGVPMLYEVFREGLMNDGDEELAQRTHPLLATQPMRTMFDSVRLSTPVAEMPVPKSFIHCQEDVIMPASVGGWHPQFSERLGMFRFVSMPGGHEVCFTDPAGLASSIIRASRP